MNMLISCVQVFTSPVNRGLQHSEGQKADFSGAAAATGESWMRDESTNRYDENNVDTKEHASPECQSTHPVVVR